MAYTYLLGWSKFDKWYYGVRYAKGCDPGELWVSYFTSSKHVKRFAGKYGKPDIVIVRKIFLLAEDAVNWEQKVLRRLNVEKNKRFLNAKNYTTKTIIIGPNGGSFKKGQKPWNTGLIYDLTKDERRKRFGRTFTEEERMNLSLRNKKRYEDNPLERIKARERTIEQFSDLEQKRKHKEKCNGHKGKMWINDGINNKRASPEEFENLKDFGWVVGRLLGEVKFFEHGNRKRDIMTGKFRGVN